MIALGAILATLIAFTPVTTPGGTLITKRKVSSLMTEQQLALKFTPVKKNGSVRHGFSGTREYITWKAMKARCYRPKAANFKHYGGKDVPVTVCGEWKNSFLTFLSDMGPKPTPKHEIERMDYSLGYCKDNCKWVTHAEQTRNSSRNIFNPEKVRMIRKLYAEGIGKGPTAKQFGVHWNRVDEVIRGLTWADIV